MWYLENIYNFQLEEKKTELKLIAQIKSRKVVQPVLHHNSLHGPDSNLHQSINYKIIVKLYYVIQNA